MKIQRINVEEIDNLKSYLEKKDSPIILTNLFNNWPSLEIAKHSGDKILRHLISQAKPELVNTLVIDEKHNGLISFSDNTFESYTFKKYDAPFQSVLKKLILNLKLKNTEVIAVQSALIKDCLTSFLKNNPSPDFLASIDPRIWIGNATTVPGHYDCEHNIALNLCGKRTFYLLPAEAISNLYVAPLDFSIAGPAVSQVDFSQPDLTKFPKFSNVKDQVLKASLNEGEALFIPPLWWHNVKATEKINILINYWWKNETTDKSINNNAPDSLLHSILTIRHLPEHQRKSWQKIFDYYVFNKSDPFTKKTKNYDGILCGNKNKIKLAYKALNSRMKSNNH
ncbi:MAG: cupin-like domain-containing protein [Pseudoalteromonas sp.]